MGVQTKPVRIFEDDAALLRLLASLRDDSTAQTVHEALAEYLANHKHELIKTFSDAQAALKSGDIDALTKMLSTSSDDQIDEMMSGLPERD